MRHFPRQVLRQALSDEALQGRMSFICGPRQIGKTTAVRRFLADQKQPQLYYNWDTPTVKRKFALRPDFFIEEVPAELPRPWVALDEIHKYPKWKNLLKGYYDEWGERVRFVVTGSARLDLFRRSGDSLVGRYFLFRMLPLGIREVLGRSLASPESWSPGRRLSAIPAALSGSHEALDGLLHVSGFPEPLAVGTRAFYRRWNDHHVSLILQEDLRDLTRIVHLRKLETLLYLLPERVGAPLSLNSLRQVLETAYGSVRLWLEALQAVYLLFSIAPWTSRLARAVRKERKYYFWDWGMVESSGPRFENFVAVQLQRSISHWNEQGEGPFRLYYIRTKDGQEVDFAVADRKGALLLVEAKEAETSLSKDLAFFQGKVRADLAVQVVRQRGLCVQKGKRLYVMGADRFFSLLP